MTGSRVYTDIVELTYNDVPSSYFASHGDKQADLTPMHQDLPTIEAPIRAVELARVPELGLDPFSNEVAILVLKFDRDFWEEQEERRKKRKEMRDIYDRKLAQAEEDRERMMF